ncbi:MAG: hypothetical protein ACJAUH_003144 [Saprospiraceae bacterium]|jgi:hypothetical protein
MKVHESFPKQKLLVEGNDDKHIIWALCQKYKLSHNFDVIDTVGVENIFKQIPIRFKQADIETIGIIIDADTNIQNRWVSIKNILEKQGLKVPETCPEKGLIVQNDDIKVGVWLMPNNETNGMIEDFIRFLVPSDDKLLPIVETHLDNIESQNLNLYTDVHRSKALIHSWLAVQETPGTPMGLAITKRYLNTDDENCQVFIDWLKRLFNQKTPS